MLFTGSSITVLCVKVCIPREEVVLSDTHRQWSLMFYHCHDEELRVCRLTSDEVSRSEVV